MASVARGSEIQVRDNFNITKVNSIPQCICCQHLQHELVTVRLELRTAKKIIELLHEETNSTAQGTYTNSQSENTSSATSVMHSIVLYCIYYAFIRSILGLVPIGYRTCLRIIQRYLE